MLEALRNQYEKNPYPPIPFVALPRPGEGKELRYETGAKLAGLNDSHRGKRILVAGCGTLEAVVVAMNHPRAREIVAVDLSERSLSILKKRLIWLKMSRPLKRLPRVSFIPDDVSQIDCGQFDYILASNLLHHSSDPAALLASLSARLKIGGFLRVVTYPKGSRYWMRQTSSWLKVQGFAADQSDLVQSCKTAIRTLPAWNPIRSCFESQPETGKLAGMIDAFFNACENPLSPMEWEEASRAAGLSLVAEAQDENSRSSMLDSFLRRNTLSVWEKLEILDDTWELCSNPIFWFKKTSESVKFSLKPETIRLPDQLRHADSLLQKAGTTLQAYQRWLSEEVGPRVHPRHPSELLRGLSLTEYDLKNYLEELSLDFAG